MTIQEKIDLRLSQEQLLRANRDGSNKWKPSLFGACFRRHWYAKTQEPETNPTDARGLRVFSAGKLFHDFVQGFYPDSQKEVLIETDKVKGYADLVSDNEVADIKSVHSDAFWYMQRNVVCILDDQKEIRFKEGDIYSVGGVDKVQYYKKERSIIKKTVLSILDEKINNWLQVGWYAKQLNKQQTRLVFVSKDDLCIQEYVIDIQKILPLLDKEEFLLYNITSLPDGKPRLYDGKECQYCNWRDKCNKDGNCEQH